MFVWAYTMKIKLITFDLDDTLWAVQPVIEHADRQLQQWLAGKAPHLGHMDSERLAALRGKILEGKPELAPRISELRYQSLRHACLEAGDTDAQAHETAEAGFQVFLAARQQVQLFAGVKVLLQRLAGRYQLAAISNGNADIRRVGLLEYFSFALNADAMGVAKPDVRMFRTALARAGCAADEAVHVGDNPHDDICGAQAAGMRSIWFNPAGEPWQTGMPPDASIQKLDELPDALSRLERL